jgi:hypothetical protein
LDTLRHPSPLKPPLAVDLTTRSTTMPPEDQDDGVAIPSASADAEEDFTASIRGHGIPTVRSVQLEIRKLVSIYQSWELEDRDLWSTASTDFRGADLQALALAGVAALYYLRRFLISHGVYITTPASDRSIDIARAILTTLQTTRYEGWDEDRYSEIKREGNLTLPHYLVRKYEHSDATSIQGSIPENTSVKSLPQTPLKGDNGHSTTPDNEPPRHQATRYVTMDDLANILHGTATRTPPPPPSNRDQPQDVDRKLITLQKLYNSDEIKYSGVDDSFDFKLKIFYDKCELAQVPPSAYLRGFSNMLTGLALTHYY